MSRLQSLWSRHQLPMTPYRADTIVPAEVGDVRSAHEVCRLLLR